MRRACLGFALVAVVSVPRAAQSQGDPLGPEFRVNTHTTSDQINSWVAADSAGNFVVVWGSGYQDGSGWGVFGQRYANSGAPLGPEFRVNTYTTGHQRLPLAASDAFGNFVVIWQSYQDGSSYGVFGQRYASSGIPLGPEFRVNTYTTGGQGFDIFGQRFASFGDSLGPEFRVNTFTFSHQGGSLDGGGVAIASDSSGNFVVVWQSYTQDGESLGIFGQRFASSGGPLGPEFRVNTYTTGPQTYPSVASDASGNFVVAWNMDDVSSYGIYGQRYDSSGTPLGLEFRVNTYMTSTQLDPAVTSGSSGDFVVIWSSYAQDGSNSGIFGQRYAGSGTPLGSEFLVNTYTPSGQFWPSVATDIAGNFVVVWQSNSQDGSSFGVFGQRFNMIVPVELMRFGLE